MGWPCRTVAGSIPDRSTPRRKVSSSEMLTEITQEWKKFLRGSASDVSSVAEGEQRRSGV